MQFEFSRSTGLTLSDGTTCEHSPQSNGEPMPKSEPVISSDLTLSAAASHARTSAAADARPESLASDQGCGVNLPEPYACFDPDSSSWKTLPISLFGDSAPFSETWPRVGMMRNGIAYPRRSLAFRTDGYGFSLWPTLLAGDASCLVKFSAVTLAKMPSGKVTTKRNGGEKLCEVLAGHFDAYLDSRFGHWLMGFPGDWTDLPPLETPSSPTLPSGLVEE